MTKEKECGRTYRPPRHVLKCTARTPKENVRMILSPQFLLMISITLPHHALSVVTPKVHNKAKVCTTPRNRSQSNGHHHSSALHGPTNRSSLRKQFNQFLSLTMPRDGWSVSFPLYPRVLHQCLSLREQRVCRQGTTPQIKRATAPTLHSHDDQMSGASLLARCSIRPLTSKLTGHPL